MGKPWVHAYSVRYNLIGFISLNITWKQEIDRKEQRQLLVDFQVFDKCKGLMFNVIRTWEVEIQFPTVSMIDEIKREFERVT